MSSDLPPGSLFANDFKIVRPLDAGGMGSVYVVEQQSTGNLRALKLMLPSLVSDAKLRERFLLEAKVGSRIESDHVVQVIAAGIDPRNNVPWLAMELLQGEELDARVMRDGPLPRPLVLEVTRQLCHALSAAHAVGVVHRDLKPKNLFLCKPRISGAQFLLKVLDFGIAKVMAEAISTGTAGMGTPLWMAPEQTEISSHVGPETDLWALGLIVYWMLTGKHYWLGAESGSTNVQVILRELVVDPIIPASARAQQQGVGHLVPPGFDAWLSRALQRSRAARFGSADLALAELGGVLAPPELQAPIGAQKTAFADEFTTRPTYADGIEGVSQAARPLPMPSHAPLPSHAPVPSHAPLPSNPYPYGAQGYAPQVAPPAQPVLQPHPYPGTMQPVMVQSHTGYAGPAPPVQRPKPQKNVGVLIGASLAGAAVLAVIIYFAVRDPKPRISRELGDEGKGRNRDAPSALVPKASKAEECKKLFTILKDAPSEMSEGGLDPEKYARGMVRTADRIKELEIGSKELVGPSTEYASAMRQQAAATLRFAEAMDEGRFDDPSGAETLQANARVGSAYSTLIDVCSWASSPPIPTTPFPEGAPPGGQKGL